MKHSQLLSRLLTRLDLLDYDSLLPHDSLILFLDFFKAFDSLEHPVLFKAAELFGFGPRFCNVIQMSYNDINSSISFSHGCSRRFPIQRGIRQGCLISPLLFIIAAELMAIHLKNSPDIKGIDILEREFKISQFADDTALL